MRVALISTAFRTREPFDLEAHVRSLAPALARAGAAVEVFTPRHGSGLAPYAQRRVEVLDHVEGIVFGVTTIELGEAPDPERIAAGFGAFLERERPSVCHFESLETFGTGVVHEARVRGIATVYCARDTWPAHDRVTLTLPDLAPFELGDADAEARAFLAETLVGPLSADGGVPEGHAERDRLRELLHEELKSPTDITALREARERVEVRRAEKRVALSAVDRRFAASRLLARQLSATVGRAFTYRAPGVDAFLLPNPPAARGKKDAVRFGFVGTTRPIEGARVLMDAFAKIRAKMDSPNVELTFGIERTNTARDTELEGRAERLGATIQFFAGPVDMQAILARLDVIVLPSLWGQFGPTVSRVALASGRPVLASDTPGIAEAVPADACLLVPPADAVALKDALLDIAKGGETYAGMRDAAMAVRIESQVADEDPDGIGTASDDAEPVEGQAKAVDAEASEWLETYRQIEGVAQARVAARRLPHVEEVTAQLEGLRELSVPELFARAQEGIGRLRRAFGINDSDASLMARVVARGGQARDRAEQSAAVEAELSQTLGDLLAARDTMQAEEAARVHRVGDLHAVLGQYEREILARGAEAARVGQDLVASREESEATAQELEQTQGRFESMAEEAESARVALGDTEAQRDQLADSVREREDALRALRGRVLDSTDEDESQAAMLESIEAHCVALERDVQTLRRHDTWLSEQAARFVALVERVRRPSKGEPGIQESDDVLERSSRVLEQLTTELEWRRGEMASAREASESFRARLAGGALKTRVQSWAAGPPVGAEIVGPEKEPKEPAEELTEESAEGPKADAEAAAEPDGEAPDDDGPEATTSTAEEPDVDEPKAALPSGDEAPKATKSKVSEPVAPKGQTKP